jgi:hypothetical protein
MKREELFNAITCYVRAAIDYEIASNQEAADGYRSSASYERKSLEMAELALKDALDKLNPAKVRPHGAD